MCKEYPGPRCSSHGHKWLLKAQENFEKVKQTASPESLEYVEAELQLRQTAHDYNCTPDGIQAAKIKADARPGDITLRKRYEGFLRQRNQQTEALNEQDNGRATNVAIVVAQTQKFYDVEELNSILSAVRKNNERLGLAKEFDSVDEIDAETQYHATINRIEQQVTEPNDDTRKALTELRSLPAPTSVVTLKTYADIMKALPRSKSSLRNELNKVASLQNVPASVAATYYDSYRKQYKNLFSAVPKIDKPDPPKEWVSGDYAGSGYQNSSASAFAPSDEASMYALYRLRVDEKSIPDYLKTSKVLAGVNLTENSTDAKPGIVFFTPKGKSLGIYEVQQGRSLKSHLPEIANQLQGKIVITQNRFDESTWMKDSLPEYGLKDVPIVTISDMSGKYLNLPDNKLSFVCEKVGLKYDSENINHESEATVKAYLLMRKKVQAQWQTKPARKNAPELEEKPSSLRW